MKPSERTKTNLFHKVLFEPTQLSMPMPRLILHYTSQNQSPVLSQEAGSVTVAKTKAVTGIQNLERGAFNPDTLIAQSQKHAEKQSTKGINTISMWKTRTGNLNATGKSSKPKNPTLLNNLFS